MLLVPTYIAPSQIQGVGLFSRGVVEGGEIVYTFDSRIDRALTKEEILSLPLTVQMNLYHLIWRNKHTELYYYFMGNENFINHSDEPNLKSITTITGEVTHKATRRIAAGEEITVNYNHFDDYDNSDDNLWALIQREAEKHGFKIDNNRDTEIY